MTRVLNRIQVGGTVIRLNRPVAPVVLKLAAGRRIILRNAACYGERLSAARALDLFFDDLMGCTIIDDLLAWRDTVEPLDPLPCPITLAWQKLIDLSRQRPTEGRHANVCPGQRGQSCPASDT